jgi:hypothetical protein
MYIKKLIYLVWQYQQRTSDASDGKHFPATPENFTDVIGQIFCRLLNRFLYNNILVLAD